MRNAASSPGLYWWPNQRFRCAGPTQGANRRCDQLSAAGHAGGGVVGGVNENFLNGAGHPGGGMARFGVPKIEVLA
jgi:hypothetical protein